MQLFEWEYLLDRTFQFNRLIHTDEDRRTEAYYNKCCDLVDEEYLDELLAWYNVWMMDESRESFIKVADGIGDTIFVTIQAAEINTPSALDYRYIDTLRSSGVYTKHKDIFIRPILDALNIGYEMDIDVFAVTKEVCDSNMTKIPTLDDVMAQYGGVGDLHEDSVAIACDSAADWIETNLGDGTEINWKLKVDTNGLDRVCFYNSNGKLMKPWCYQEPNLEYILFGGYDED